MRQLEIIEAHFEATRDKRTDLGNGGCAAADFYGEHDPTAEDMLYMIASMANRIAELERIDA